MRSNVNLSQINEQLEILSAKYKNLDSVLIDFDVLHAKTGSIIFEACYENTWAGEVSERLIELWFPEIHVARTLSGSDLEQFWILVFEIDDIIFKAGYRGEAEFTEYIS